MKNITKISALGMGIACVMFPLAAFAQIGLQGDVNTNVGVSTKSSASTTNRALIQDASTSLPVSASITSNNIVTTDADVSVYAQSVSSQDNNVTNIDTNSDNSVSVSYSEPAKLFGFIPISTKVTLKSDASGNVTVSHPWYSFLMSTRDDSALRTTAQTYVDTTTGGSLSAAQGSASLSSEAKAKLIGALHQALQTSLNASANANANASASDSY